MRISKSTNIEASTTDVLEPTVDNVLDLIENKKIIFKNDVAYWSRGKRVLPKEYRDCIYETQYAHWINEWSCEQAEKFGDRAYYDYDGDTEVKASNMRISKSNKTSVKASKESATTSTDKALQHIKAAIDILGKSGDKSDVTKDSIANLATVMFDIKASTVTAASKCKYSKKECIDAIQDQYGKNKKEAEEYYKSADAKTLEALVDGFKGNAKKAFLDD